MPLRPPVHRLPKTATQPFRYEFTLATSFMKEK